MYPVDQDFKTEASRCRNNDVRWERDGEDHRGFLARFQVESRRVTLNPKIGVERCQVVAIGIVQLDRQVMGLIKFGRVDHDPKGNDGPERGWKLRSI